MAWSILQALQAIANFRFSNENHNRPAYRALERKMQEMGGEEIGYAAVADETLEELAPKDERGRASWETCEK
jgi:hypothetical protein